MRRPIAQFARLAILVSLAALGAAAAPAVSAGNPCFHGFSMPPTSTGPGSDVKLLPCAFEPTVTTVAVGSAVTFFNGPDFTHLITGAGQAWGSPEVELRPGDSISYTFDKAGIYPYACALHPGMSGAIVVGDLTQALSVGTTEASTDQGSTTTDASAASAPTASTTSTSLPVALGAVGGLIVIAATAWLAIRRRSTVDQGPVRAE